MNRYALRCEKGCDCRMSGDSMCSNKLIFIRVGASITYNLSYSLRRLDLSDTTFRLIHMDDLICYQVENGVISI